MSEAVSFRIAIRTPSLNEYARMHWAARGRLADEFALHLVKAKGRLAFEPFRVPVRLTVTRSYRSQPLDEDNGVGGLKPLIDALKGKDEVVTLAGRPRQMRTGLCWIVEDSPAWCRVWFRQVQDSQPWTTVRLEPLEEPPHAS